MDWLKKHKFEARLISFALVVLPPIGMFFAAQVGAGWLILVLMAATVAGALLAVMVP